MVKTKLFLLILSFVLVFGCSKGKEGSEEPKKTEDTMQKETPMEKPAVGTESKTEEAAAKVEEAASAVGEAVKEKTTEMTEAVKEAVEGGIGSDGAQLFQSKGCAGCHQVDTDTVGPSLQTITKVYKEKNANIITYLKGESESIVVPEKSSMMKPLLNPLKSLSDEELQALADYIEQ